MNNSYNYFLSLTSQFYFCGIPFRLDTKPKCEFNCLYCFAMARGGRRTNTKLIAEFDSLNRVFKHINNKKKSNISELLKYKLPIHFGGMCDPFDNAESTKVSIQFLKILSENNYPTILSTKNTQILLTKEVQEQVQIHKNLIIQVSLISSDDRYLKIIEPNLPSFEERLESIYKLKSTGQKIVIRLQPIFPHLMDDICNNLIPKLAGANIDHFIFEHLKLPVERNIGMIGNLETKTGWKLYDYYLENKAELVGREWLLPNNYKYKNIQLLSNLVHKYNITYSCADYGLQHYGDTDCCCGIDKFWENSNWFKGNIVNVIKKSSEEVLTIKLLEDSWYPSTSIKRIINSNSRLDGNNLMKDYLLKKWNSPNTINSPDHLFGIDFIGRDKNYNCIYKKIKDGEKS